MNRLLSTLLLSFTLAAPVALQADNRDHDHDKVKRYYDREARDWHEWNEREERAYRRYLEEKRREYHDWGKARREDQRDYWKWRHEHSDTILFPDRR
jgi:Ni/Co efflux regulator RcnB